MKNVSTYSDIRQYITKTFIIINNLFLFILFNSLSYNIVNLYTHTTFCIVGNIIILLINIYILNKNKRLIPDNNNIQELQNQREIDILLTDSIEEKIRIDFKYKKRLKEQKYRPLIITYTFLFFIFLTNILSILNNMPSSSLPTLFYIPYILYFGLLLNITISYTKSSFFTNSTINNLIITIITTILISIYSIIIPFIIAIIFITISGYFLYCYIVYIFTIKK